MTEGKSYAIGIDLGTTYSCVGVFKDGAVKIIHNDHGSPTTASYVAFTQEERLIGDIAKTKVVTNPHNTVFDAKRLIGRKFNDGTVQEDMKHWPFTVINDKNRPKIEVVYKGAKKVFTPEEISSMVLTKMKETAETYLRQKVKDAVITVPAYFNDAQRQATKDAAAIAGLNVLRIINEPTAAGIAYALDEKTPKQQNILIYDLGGGTFDVTVMTIKNGNFHVKATAGDTHLGGEDFDNCLVNYFVREFKRLHNKDLTTNPRALRRLRVACERAKRVLSHTTQATIESESLCDGIDFFQDISRSRFDELCVHLFKQTLEPVEKALKDAKMDKSEIDEIVLVGGSTRIPKVQKLLSEFFGDKTLNKTLHPDEAVAWGAAVEAAILNGDKSKAIQDVVITDITPYSLGIECTNDVMSTVIKRNSSIPIKVRRTDYDTSVDYQEDCLFAVYEGEDPVSKNNRLLGKFSLWGIRKALQGEVKFEVTFEIDRNGILNVSATERGTENSGNITITSNSGYLTREEIDEMTKNESHYRENDRTQKLIKEARNRLESLI